MNELMTLTEALPHFAKAAERDPENWWQEFQKRYDTSEGDHWMKCHTVDDLLAYPRETRYRIKPKTVKRTIEYPEPLTGEPEEGAEVWLALPGFYDWGRQYQYARPLSYYSNNSYDVFTHGLLHATKEAAEAHGRALAGVE